MLSEDHDEESTPWRRFLLEDGDELLRANAKEAVGQALSRLLNVADGRSGKACACWFVSPPMIEVPRFDRAQASRWLGRPVAREESSLAELYAMASGSAGLAIADEPKVGLYL